MLLEYQINLIIFTLMFGQIFFTSLITTILSGVFYAPVRSLYKFIKLVDTPSWRKGETLGVPLGGGMILVLSFFSGTLVSQLLYPAIYSFNPLFYLGIVVMFVAGTIDDAFDLRPILKFFIQIVIAIVTIRSFDLHLTEFGGLLGIEDLSITASWALTVVYFLVFVNMFNLIDGIDGLALAIALIGLIFLSGTMVISGEQNQLFTIAVFMGSIIVLIIKNFSFDKMFLGDAGSLTLGYILAVLILVGLSRASIVIPNVAYARFAPVYAMSIFWYPLFDVIRVFLLRLFSGRSPFSPDRRHLHHLLVDRGYSHLFTTLLISAMTIILTILSFYLSKIYTIHLDQFWSLNALFLTQLALSWFFAYLFLVGWPINLLPARNTADT